MRGDTVLAVLVQREVSHEVVWRRSVPVFLARGEVNCIAGADHLGRGPAPLGDAQAIGHV